MANAGRGGVGQPALEEEEETAGSWRPRLQILSAQTLPSFSSTPNSSVWIQLRCASFPFRPNGPGLSARPGSRTPFRAFLFFFLSSFFVRLKILHPGPLLRLLASPAHPGCCSAADDGLLFIWSENWLGRLDRTAATTRGHSTPDNVYPTTHSTSSVRGDRRRRRDKLSSVRSTSPTGRPVVVGNRQRLTLILTTWALGGAGA